MKYVIMAGRNLTKETGSEIPKQLWKAGKEYIICRTIRLLKKYGVTDIAISTQDDRFQQLGLPILRHNNRGPWINGFYPTKEPTCYVMGDVVFSEDAIKTIVSTETDDIEFFASAPPFPLQYPKHWAEPFAFKVVNIPKFRESIDIVRKGIEEKKWKRDPIAWELWQVIKGTEWNKIDYTNFTVINDFTCDVDNIKDLEYYKDMGRLENSEYTTSKARYMIHACPQRMWYVDEFLIPALLERGITKDQITVYCDTKKEGNLKACMHAFQELPDDDGGTWHLQDDVLPCRDFKKRTEQYNVGFVAGFVSQRYDAKTAMGLASMHGMPWSFPCIRIPNKAARECADWVLNYVIGNPVYANNVKGGNGDDWAFKLYAQNFQKDKAFYNMKPSLVEHIDWLIGGSSVGSRRNEPTVARYFEDQDLVKRLEKDLSRRK